MEDKSWARGVEGMNYWQTDGVFYGPKVIHRLSALWAFEGWLQTEAPLNADSCVGK